MSGKITLSVVEGAMEGKEFVFNQHDTFLFGRMDDCHICLLDDGQISRHHCILEVNPPAARIRDLGSKNGTYINGKKYGGRAKGESPEEGAKRQYEQVDLRNGDTVKLGQTKLLVKVEASAAGAHGRILCIRCGRDITHEVGPGQQGDFVCAACQDEIADDPALLLFALFKQIQQEMAEEANGPSIHIPDYTVEQKIGAGGMGVVYRVRHVKNGNRAALKVMLSKVAVDTRARERFKREINVTRALKHTNVVGFIDSGVIGSVFYCLLEYCDSGSVAELMQKRGGKVALPEAAPIMLDVLNGLAFIHASKVVHRDLKPQNILLSRQNGRVVAKVADMGLAKSFEQAGFSGLTVTGNVAGTLAFMPREQLTDFKDLRPISDVWSIAATFYNMLTGSYPRNMGPKDDPIEIVLNAPIVPISRRNANIPPTVAQVIDRALAVDLGSRYPNAGEMYSALARVLR